MNEHNSHLEPREVRVLRHTFVMSHELEKSVGEFFEPTRKGLHFSGFYATRELVIDGYEYSQHRYHDFLEFSQRQFEKVHTPILLGRSTQTAPAIRFREATIGNREVTQVALRPLNQGAFNTLIESMNTTAINMDPQLAAYQDLRPALGDHFLVMDVHGARLIEPAERQQLVRRFSSSVVSHFTKNLYYVRPDMITTKSEIREVVPHPKPDPYAYLKFPPTFNTDDAA